jgi:hypothetical protein
MEKQDSLKEIERRAYRSTFKDGIYDVLFGMVFVILALIPVLASLGISRFYGYLLGIVTLLFTWLGKRVITVPRLGAVVFGPRRKMKKRMLFLICAAVFFLQLPLLMITLGNGFPGIPEGILSMPLTLGLILAPFLLIAAFLLDYPRLYVYIAIFAFAIPHAGILRNFVAEPFNLSVSFGVPGVAILIFGLALFFRFLREYQKPSAEAGHEE